MPRNLKEGLEIRTSQVKECFLKHHVPVAYACPGCPPSARASCPPASREGCREDLYGSRSV